ncbi:MAG: M48 metallopeptidase family protein [Lentisphaeria bacterium]
MSKLKYLQGYPTELVSQVEQLINDKKLAKYLQKKYPQNHCINSDKALYDYVMGIKNRYLKNAGTINKVLFDVKIKLSNQALGLHSFISRVQGGKLKAKNEIRITPELKNAPELFLRAVVVHELAHIKEKDHDKAFYKLCEHMQPNYHQLEFDMRLYLTMLDLDESFDAN